MRVWCVSTEAHGRRAIWAPVGQAATIGLLDSNTVPPGDLPSRTVPRDSDADARSQDSAGAGRSIGLGFTTILGALLIAIPVIWAIAYLAQAGTAGAGGGFAILVVLVLLACIGAGVLLLRGLLRS